MNGDTPDPPRAGVHGSSGESAEVGAAPAWVHLAIPPLPRGTVVLVSTGVDSVLGAAAHPDAICLFVDYGQPHVELERAVARRLFGPRLEVVEIRPLGPQVGEGGAFIPNRNLLFACLGAQRGDRLILGAMADDYSPDKTPTAMAMMSGVLTAFGERRVTVETSTPGLMRHEAVARFLLQGGDPARVLASWSCYGPGPERCLDCRGCFRWGVTMRANGLNVPLCSDRIIAAYQANRDQYPARRLAAIDAALGDLTQNHPSRWWPNDD